MFERVLITGERGFVGRHCLPLLLAQVLEVHATTWQPLTHPAPTDKPRIHWHPVDLLNYDWRYGYLDENLTPLTTTTCGRCKLALWHLVWAYCEQVNLSYGWRRIFFMYGPHKSRERLVASVIQSLLRGEIARTSYAMRQRDLLFIQDLSDAFVALPTSNMQGAVNIASSIATPLHTIITEIAAQIGELPTQPNESPVPVVNVRRLRDEVGWQPHVTLSGEIARTISWWCATETQNGLS